MAEAIPKQSRPIQAEPIQYLDCISLRLHRDGSPFSPAPDRPGSRPRSRPPPDGPQHGFA